MFVKCLVVTYIALIVSCHARADEKKKSYLYSGHGLSIDDKEIDGHFLHLMVCTEVSPKRSLDTTVVCSGY